MRLLILIGLPFVAAMLSQVFRNIRIAATGLSLALLFAELMILRGVAPQYAFTFGTMILTVSPLAHFLFSLIIGLVGIIVLYSYGMRSDHLTSAAFVVLGGIAAILLLNNFILITLLIEITGVGIVLFVGGPRVTKGGVNSATKYLAAAIIASVFTVFAFLLVDYYRLSTENDLLARLVLALLVVGFGIRLGGFPFHFWLPSFSHHSPPMVTALLVSLLNLAILAFGIVVLSTFPWLLESDEARNLLTTGGMIGAVLGATIALGQSSINRVLAYATVSEMGLIVFGLGSVSTLGLTGAVFEAVTMSLGMLLLLMSAGIVIRCCGNSDLARLGGLGSRLPVAAIGFIAGGLSIAGFPPFGGFASRWVLLNAASRAQGAMSVWIVGVGILLVLAFARTLRKSFLGEEVGKRVGSEAFVPSVAIILLTAVILGIGLYPAPWFDHIKTALAGISLIKSG